MLPPLREAAHLKLVRPVVERLRWEEAQAAAAAAVAEQQIGDRYDAINDGTAGGCGAAGGCDGGAVVAAGADVARATHLECRDFVDGFNHLCELRRGSEWVRKPQP
jgi:hypothetical protein